MAGPHDARAYLFLDESGVTTDLRRAGRSHRGLRLRDYTPCGRWQAQTVIAPLRIDGLHAPAVFDGPLDNPTFLAYVEQVLAPTLQPGDVACSTTCPCTSRRRCRWPSKASAPPALLPAYRPDFNPIELAFAKLKAFLRAVRPRTFDQIVAIALRLFTPQECRNFVRHCGCHFATDL